MRRNNLELRKVHNREKMFEIVKWYPNTYYGKESDYDFDGEWYKPKGSRGHSISPSCFANPESCYVIVFIEDGLVDFIGDRAIELETMEEMKDFLFLLRKGIKKSLKYKL